MGVRFQQRFQLTVKAPGAFALGVVVTVATMAALVYWQSRLPRLGSEAERYLGER